MKLYKALNRLFQNHQAHCSKKHDKWWDFMPFEIKNIPRTLLEYHLSDVVKLDCFRGVILNVGCGETTYEEFLPKSTAMYKVDWPSTLHDVFVDAWCDVHNLPFKNELFDLVICTEVLEHVKVPQAVLAEIYRVLKPNGLMFLTAPFLYSIHEAPYDFYRYTYYGLKWLLSTIGFQIEFIKPRGELLGVIVFFLRRFADKITKKLLGNRLGSLIPWIALDRIYLLFFLRKCLNLNASNVNYTLGYSVLAKKN